MSVTVSVISGSNGIGFQTALRNSISSGSSPTGNPWSDATNTYQEVLIYDTRELSYNPDLLSRPFRGKQGILNTYPTSSQLAVSESAYYYQ